MRVWRTSRFNNGLIIHIAKRGRMDGLDYRQSMLWYEIAGKVLYYVTLPVVYILLLLFYVLRFLLSPFIYTAQVVVHVCLIPYSIAAKFEAGLP